MGTPADAFFDLIEAVLDLEPLNAATLGKLIGARFKVKDRSNSAFEFLEAASQWRGLRLHWELSVPVLPDAKAGPRVCGEIAGPSPLLASELTARYGLPELEVNPAGCPPRHRVAWRCAIRDTPVVFGLDDSQTYILRFHVERPLVAQPLNDSCRREKKRFTLDWSIWPKNTNPRRR